MKIKSIEEFKENCINKYCNRNTIYNEKTCLRESKQNQCYKKYVHKIEKKNEKIQYQKQEWEEKKKAYFSGEIDSLYDEIEIDEKDIELKKILFKRDLSIAYDGNSYFRDWIDKCVIFNYIFTDEERKEFVLNNFFKYSHNQFFYLDVVHIESRARNPELKYEPTNCVIGGRYIHYFLDNYFDLVTGEKMNEERRNYWLNRLKKYVKGL